MQENIIQENKELSIWEALIPVIALVAILAYNVFVFGDDALSGSNQFVLLIGAAVAAIVGFRNKVSYKTMMTEIRDQPQWEELPILVSSASVNLRDQQRSLEQGGDDWLSKPVQLEELLALLEKHLSLKWCYRD